MTIITTQSRITYAGDNVSTVFPIPFEFFLNSDITVVKNAVGGGVSTLVLNVDYTLSGANTPSGGSATKTTPLLTGETLALFLNPPITQGSHYLSNGPFPASTLENDIDRQTQISQRVTDILTRSLRAPDGDPASGTVGFLLPSSVARANTFLTFDGNGNPTTATALVPGTVLSAATVGAVIGPQTAAEAAAGVSIVASWLPVGNMQRYGIIPNNSGLASANGAILQTLVSATFANGPKGAFYFPNTTGNDTYYFDLRFYQLRDGIHIDGQNCILNFSTGSPSAKPLFMAIRDFRFENATIQYTYNSGAVDLFRLGSRYNDGIGWPANPVAVNGILDQDTLLAGGLPLQGNFILRNLRISYNNSATACINLIGGLRNVELSNIAIDGAGTAYGGIYYEYGFASLNGQPGTSSAWTSSHANNMKWRNIVITNTGTTSSNFGVGANGAGDLSCENIYVNGSYTGMTFGSGEAFYFRMWAPDGQGGGGTFTIPKLINVRNVLLLVSGVGIAHVGAQNVGGAYIAPAINALAAPQKYQAQTDYLNLDLDGFRIYCDSGVSFSGSQGHIRNGVIQGQGTATSGGIFLGAETIHVEIEKVQILNCNGPAVRANTASTVWPVKRPQFVRVADCFIAGNTAGIQLDYCQSAIIENNQLGYNTTYNVAAETVQTVGINVGVNCLASAVVCRNNFTSVPGGGTSYSNIGPLQVIQSERNAAYNTSGNWVQQTPAGASTGWGVPTGAVIISNFPGATATLLQTSEAMAYVITILKQNGLMAA